MTLLFGKDGMFEASISKCKDKWMFPKIGVPQNGWFIVENPIKMDDWGYHYFWKHPNKVPGAEEAVT